MEVELTESERAARRLIEASRARRATAQRSMICNVFRAMWASAVPVDRVIQIAEAMHASAITTSEHGHAIMRKELTRMVRAGYLRSRVSEGQRLYEVAYQ